MLSIDEASYEYFFISELILGNSLFEIIANSQAKFK
jgi:hypothetical protein